MKRSPDKRERETERADKPETPEHINVCTIPGCGVPALDQPKSAGRSVCFDHDTGR